MIVYCVMEDWYNKQPMSKDYNSYQDKLIAIFNSQHDALNNILINVDRGIYGRMSAMRSLLASCLTIEASCLTLNTMQKKPFTDI